MSIQYSSPLPYLGMLASARPVCPTWSQFDKHSRRWKSSRSSNALDFQAAFRDIILLKRVITIITLMNKKIFHSLFLACASFASASLSVPWNQAACNANKHSKPSGMFYLRFISSYFFSSRRKLFPTVLSSAECTRISFVCACVCCAHTYAYTKTPPARGVVAVWCRGVSCRVRLPAVRGVIFCSRAQGVFLRRADKAKENPFVSPVTL